MEDGQETHASLSDVEVRRKELKDAELDEKIKALKKKNEALVRRHEEKRVVSENRNSSDSENEQRCVRVGKEMQLTVTMDSKLERKRVAIKKNDQGCYLGISNVSNTTMEDVDHLFSFGRGHRRQVVIAMEQEAKKKEGKKYEEGEKIGVEEQSNKDHLEYLRWKKEREQIDLTRVARHKNAQGEWRRPWDMEKTEDMFKDDPDTVPSGLCSNTGFEKSVNMEKIQTKSSQAKGKDRLTGRAQRFKDDPVYVDTVPSGFCGKRGEHHVKYLKNPSRN
ncbi:coiled-coil domain-containing protein 9B isoform 2-T2 [Mantella aurantiaca]